MHGFSESKLEIANEAESVALHKENMAIQDYVKEQLIPLLDKSYQNAKNHLKGPTRKYAYSIRKSLIDLLDGSDAVSLVRYPEQEFDLTFFEASYQMVYCLNSIYFFVVELKSNTNTSDSGIMNTIKRLIKDIKLMQDDIFKLSENCRNSEKPLS
ncbi:MAG TPA: hypothetical protein VF941_12320 [Clostridia bacterium]